MMLRGAEAVAEGKDLGGALRRTKTERWRAAEVPLQMHLRPNPD